MLTIQRASAGSGKTYTLAKKYILNLIAFQNEKGDWKIRNNRQIEDALQHILAITFTNKATNEMKQRITTNLSQMARAADSDITEELLKNTPYLKEFSSITGADYKTIGKAAADALKILLNNYSKFKISTIDSFFQEILRTFTFEANLNDSYQLEIDSSFVNESALDEAIQELDRHPEKMGHATVWLRYIMKEEAKKSQLWNPFSKSRSSRSIYAALRRALTQLEKEEFKDIKESLDDYFSHEDNIARLPKNFLDLRQKATDERDNLLKNIVKKAAAIEYIILSQNLGAKINKNFQKLLPKITTLSHKTPFKNSYESYRKAGTVFNSSHRTLGHPLDALVMDLIALLDEWVSPSPGSYYKSWTIYGELMPYLGVIMEVRSFLRNVLESNNLIQLSDTGYILRKIIGDDDAPFVYERLGNRIDHYLIDEFQDTSRMQWDIIYPLLAEGLSKDKDSLIIGDPKQSIYRFRNADHRLITEVVPRVFPLHNACGDSLEDNTNWRSATKVVKFNNYFFKTLAEEITRLSESKATKKDFSALYSNVVQYPHNQSDSGYVEIRVMTKPENGEDDSDFSDGDDGDSGNDWFTSAALKNIGPLVSSLVARGYAQKDIGILVNKNRRGTQVVESLIAYNDSLPELTPKIDFISEESLLISSSPAVQTIISVLEKIAAPASRASNKKAETSAPEGNGSPETSAGESPDEKVVTRKYYNWNNIRNDYHIFSHDYPDMDPAQRIMLFLNQENKTDEISVMLSKMSVPTLSALVETAIQTFLDEATIAKNAIYLAAFQDIVSDYMAGHPTDVASFLEWWKARGVRNSVSSPEGLDAVRIMTIHKSKGLEFKCVIVPFATDDFMPGILQEEWRWVNPGNLEDISLPPVLPVKTSRNLLGSVHEHIYKEYLDEIFTDRLNMYYVAFTRARNELYVFTKDRSRVRTAISGYLHQILKSEILPADTSEEWLMNIDDITLTEFEDTENKIASGIGEIITYGRPFSQEEIDEEHRKENEKAAAAGKIAHKYLHTYSINSRRPRLRSVASKVTSVNP